MRFYGVRRSKIYEDFKYVTARLTILFQSIFALNKDTRKDRKWCRLKIKLGY